MVNTGPEPRRPEAASTLLRGARTLMEVAMTNRHTDLAKAPLLLSS